MGNEINSEATSISKMTACRQIWMLSASRSLATRLSSIFSLLPSLFSLLSSLRTSLFSPDKAPTVRAKALADADRMDAAPAPAPALEALADEMDAALSAEELADDIDAADDGSMVAESEEDFDLDAELEAQLELGISSEDNAGAGIHGTQTCKG